MTGHLTRTRARRSALVMGAALTVSLVAACSSPAPSNTSSPGASGSAPSSGAVGTGDVAAIDQILAKAPVAPASAIPSGTLMDQIKKRGELKVGGTDTGPLFSLRNPVTGKLTGFDADLSKMLAKYIIGTPKTALSQTSVDTREAMLQNGSVDTVFATYTITPKRAQKVDFAGPYYASGDAILVRKSNTSITKVGDLNGKTVATEGNSTAATAIAKFAPKAKVILFQTNDECVQAVRQGRADAYVLDQGILIGAAAKNPEVKVVGAPFTTEPYGIGISKSHPEMKKFVNDWLRQIEADGLWAQLWKATIGTVVSGNAPQPPAIGSVPGS